MKIRRALPALIFSGLLALVPSAPALYLSPLAERPDWSSLDKYQESITRTDFVTLLDGVYAPGGGWKPFITVGDFAATIQTSAGQPPYILRFAPAPGLVKPAPRFWRQKSQLPARPEALPLNGIRIALDPGHLGGAWAKMEERWFQIGKSKPVTEGDMTLLVARLLVPRLQALGATVYLTRKKAGPVTPQRPARLGKAAAADLADKKQPATAEAVQKETELLFYRVSEIRQRARLINETIRPDLVLCLHFNAEPWGDEHHPTLTDKNHLHLLVTGCFAAKELAYDDQRLDLLRKLLSRAYPEELAVAESIAASLGQATELPAYQYEQASAAGAPATASALKVGRSPYVWARNLLANRLFQCPVVYIEPYVMNSHAAFARIQAGDYPGKQAVDGRMQPSIFREYADAVARGLANYYSSNE